MRRVKHPLLIQLLILVHEELVAKFGTGTFALPPHEVQFDDGLSGVMSLVLKPIDHVLEVRLNHLQELFLLHVVQLPEGLVPNGHGLPAHQLFTDFNLRINSHLAVLHDFFVQSVVHGADDPI